MVKQVPLPPSHPIPHQLLTLHAILRLYPWYNGQNFRLITRKFAHKEGRSTWRGASHSSHNSGIHISSTPRIHILGFWTSVIQVVFMVNVASHYLVHDGYLDLRANIHCWEECVQTPKTTNMGYSQIHCSSKDYNMFWYKMKFSWHLFRFPVVLHAMAERSNKWFDWG